MALPTQLIHVRIARELLVQTDQAAQKLFVDRSEYVRQAIVEKLRTAQTMPSSVGVNILMSDIQLDELMLILQIERRRRRNRGVL